MNEYFFPYEGQGYQLQLERVSPSSKPRNSSVRKIYQQLVPASFREILWIYRHHQHISYPARIESNFEGSKNYFIAHTRKDEVRIQSNGYEHDYIEAASKVIKDGDVIWDIGAYQGTWTIPLASKHTNNTFIAFEPDPVYFDILQNNIKENKLNSVYVYPYAISNITSVQELCLHSQHEHCSALRQIYPAQTAAVTKVQTISIDDCVSLYSISKPDLIKIDVEGAEQMVLEGMYSVRPRDIFLEIHSPDFLKQYGTDAVSIYYDILKKGYEPKSIWMRENAMLCHFQQGQ